MHQTLWLGTFFGFLIWSGINPKDTLTWFLEVAPALAVIVVLAFTRRSFPLTPLLYGWLLLHCVVLMIGGHYTYAEVPAFDWLSEQMGWQRNNFDKLGHFLQGFVPALVAREVLIRFEVLRKPAWIGPVVVCFALAVSAFYELIEWWAALLSAEAAEAFLGTQGYVWDTQSDMLMALIGALAALAMLSRRHDRQLAALSSQP